MPKPKLRLGRLKINQQALILFVVISVTPVLALNTYWLVTQQDVLRSEAERRQTLLTQSAAERANSFMSQKVKALILHSQSTSILKNETQESHLQLTNYIKQDQDIEKVQLLDENGQNQITLYGDNAGQLKRNDNFDSQEAFRFATFLGGKEYISPVHYIDNDPYVQIAVPVLTFSRAQDFSELSTSERGVIRSSEDVNGALLITVNLSQLWDAVFADAENSPTFSYIVDDKKHLIGHPDREFSGTRTDLSTQPAVRSFIDNQQSSQKRSIETTGINNEPVLATHAPVPLTSWSVITEEPLDGISQSADEVATTVWTLNIIIALLAIALSYMFSRHITRPIQKLAAGADEIGEGNLDTQIHIDRNDEVGMLAHNLNSMGQRIKALVERINTERQQLDIVLNSINEGVFAMDGEGKIMLANTPALTLFDTDSEHVNGATLKELATFKQDVAEIVIDVNDIDPEENVVEYKNLKFTGSDEKEHFVDIIIARVPHSSANEGEQAIQYLATVVDQTEARELEAMKIDFVSMAAHELRTPLTAIRGYMELILNDKNVDLPDQFRQYLLQGYESTIQLSGLINNLLNVSKIERNALQMSMDKLDLAKLVSSSVRNQQFSAEKAKLTLAYTGEDSEVFVVGDVTALREVIDNLITNAIHYTPEDGKVTVSLDVEDDYVVTSVEDTGIGISEESVKKLFTKFFRVHGGLATGSGGSGLGLYISKSIVESHGGTIWVDSTEGVGSTFSFKLPLFTQERYESLKDTSQTESNIRREHGWITKNSTR